MEYVESCLLKTLSEAAQKLSFSVVRIYETGTVPHAWANTALPTADNR
jgi:hypothetical protein